MIGREDLARLTAAVKEAAEDMKKTHTGEPTIFEVETALAFLYFAEQNCDIVVLETGLGGALDATNVITTSVLEVIASVSMDHMDFLGDTLDKIALQKAGIIKPHTRVVSALQKPEAMEVIEETCRKQECVLNTADPGQVTDISHGYDRQKFSYKQWKDMEISLMGSYQLTNAALALEAVDSLRNLGYRLEDQAVYRGMKRAVWRGRFTVISREPVIVMDGAHNPAAAEELKKSLELYFPDKKLFYIFGMFRDKDYKKVTEITAPLADHIITVETPDNPRALSAKKLKDTVEKINPSVEAAESIRSAVRRTMEQAREEDVIVIFGSLSFLAEAELAVSRYKKEEEI